LYIVAIDVGTSSMKSVLYNDSGKLLKVFMHEYYSEYPQEGYVEQDPVTWKDALEDVLCKMGDYCSDQNLKVDALSVTSQRSSLIPMDENGEPLCKAIMWQDKRTLPQCDKLIEEFGLDYFYQKTGLRINPYFVLPKILWLQENETEIFNKAVKFIGVMDYVVKLLTDAYVTDHSQACRTCLMDIKEFKWDPELLKLGNIQEEQLPKLVAPGTVAGGLVSDLAERANLAAGIPVVLGGGDQQASAIALGVIKQGSAEANTGTGSFVLSAVDKPYFDKENRVLLQAAAIPGKWIMEAGIFNTGAVYRWFRNNFYKELDGQSNAYLVMNEEAQNSKPGANGIMMIPHFQGSAAPFWNPLAKGVFFNLSLDDTRGDFARSILEGISLEIAVNIKLIQKIIGDLEVVSVAGGMTNADLFCEIQANSFDRKVARYENPEASSLGAAMIAAVSLGVYKDFEEAFARMVQNKPKIFEPDAKLVEIYRHIYIRKMVLYDAISVGEVYDAYVED